MWGFLFTFAVMTKIRLSQPKLIVKLDYPIALLNSQIRGLSDRKKYCENHDHSKATPQEQEYVKIFLATVDQNIDSLKKAVKKLEK